MFIRKEANTENNSQTQMKLEQERHMGKAARSLFFRHRYQNIFL
jgi:hypothetical protein